LIEAITLSVAPAVGIGVFGTISLLTFSVVGTAAPLEL